MTRRAAVCVLALAALVPARGTALQSDLSLSSSSGIGSSAATSPCDGSGAGSDSLYRFTGHVAGSPGALQHTFEASLDLHREVAAAPTEGTAEPGFLRSTGNTFTIHTPRGDVHGAFSGGSCAAPSMTVAHRGSTLDASGSGTWTITGGTGAYASVTGNGTFALRALLTAGGDSTLLLRLTGPVAVAAPAIRHELMRAFWASPLDYAQRTLTVTIRVSNTGAYAYDTLFRVESASGFVSWLGEPAALGTLAPGASVVIDERFALPATGCPVPREPCGFTATLRADAVDALGVPATATGGVNVRIPLLPTGDLTS